VFTAWIDAVRRSGRRFVRLCEIADEACAHPIPEATVARGRIAGRSGWVTVAGGV
jgi:hypothetical protein